MCVLYWYVLLYFFSTDWTFGLAPALSLKTRHIENDLFFVVWIPKKKCQLDSEVLRLKQSYVEDDLSFYIQKQLYKWHTHSQGYYVITVRLRLDF
jgi:hypothetical protein